MKHLNRKVKIFLAALSVIVGLFLAFSPIFIDFSPGIDTAVMCAGLIVACLGGWALSRALGKKPERKGGNLPKAVLFWVIALFSQFGSPLRNRCVCLVLCTALTAACAVEDHKSEGIDEKGILSLILSAIFFVLFVLKIVQVWH